MGESKSHLHPIWGQGGRLTQPQTSLALLQTQVNKPEKGKGNPQCTDKTEAQWVELRQPSNIPALLHQIPQPPAQVLAT